MHNYQFTAQVLLPVIDLMKECNVYALSEVVDFCHINMREQEGLRRRDQPPNNVKVYIGEFLDPNRNIIGAEVKMFYDHEGDCSEVILTMHHRDTDEFFQVIGGVNGYKSTKF